MSKNCWEIENEHEITAKYKPSQIHDSVRATIVSSSAHGVFLRTDNGEDAFACFGGRIGDRVLCTVRRPASADKRMLVSIDSVFCGKPGKRKTTSLLGSEEPLFFCSDIAPLYEFTGAMDRLQKIA